MKKKDVFNKLNFHLGYIKIAVEITMRKFVSENDDINDHFYSCDKKRGNIRYGQNVGKIVDSATHWGTVPGQE